MRYVPLVFYVAITIWFLFFVASDYMFGRGDPKVLAKRVGIALVWPIALFSSAGRKILLQTGSEL